MLFDALSSLIASINSMQWNYGTAGNQAQAKSLLAAMKATGFNFGIYSTPGVSILFQHIWRIEFSES